MKLHLTVATIALGLALSLTAAFAADVKIVVECESSKSVTPSMKISADSTASKGKCIEIPLRRPHATTETGPSDKGNAVYKINVPQTATYQFWGRCWWYDACGNSFFVLIDSDTVTAKTPYITDQTFKKWHWVAGPSVKLTKGVHTIRIQNREDGAKMDQFLLHTRPKSRYQPSRPETETPQHIAK